MKKRVYDGIKLPSPKIQKILFGDVFTRSELFVLFEMLFYKDFEAKAIKGKQRMIYRPFSSSISIYSKDDFYIAINSLIKRGIVEALNDPRDKRKKNYFLKPGKLAIRVAYWLSVWFYQIYYEGTYLLTLLNNLTDQYSKKDYVKNYPKISSRIRKELKTVSVLDEVEFEIDGCIQIKKDDH